MSALACSQPSQHVAGRNFQVPSQNTTPAEFTASNKVSLASSSGLALAHRASSWALVQAQGLWLHSFASVHVYTHLWSVCPTIVILGREDPGVFPSAIGRSSLVVPLSCGPRSTWR